MKSNYDRVTDINIRKQLMLYVSSLITLFLTLNEEYKFCDNIRGFEAYKKFIIGLNLVLIVVYIMLDFRAAYIFSRAERTRTLQYLDNSFDTNFSGKKVENYFTQDKLNPGFYKLAVNCFENVFHTSNVLREMQKKVYFKSGAIFLVFIFSAAVGDKGLVRSLIEAILPLILIQDAIKLFLFISRLEALSDNFKSFFTAIKETNFDKKEPEAMRYIIEYETTLAWASTPTESKIFLKMQTQLANEWEILKEQYKIKQN